jgi:hypothetical protein
MRTYGRVYSSPTTYTWVEVDTDVNGFNDAVYLTTLVQCLKLNLGESPFYGTWGIPATDSVIQQVAPDYSTVLTQQRFAQYFASLVITKTIKQGDAKHRPVPTYQVNVVTHQGATQVIQVPI